MFILTLFLMFAGFFSPENLATTIVGGLAAYGLTAWFKRQTGAMGVGAMFLALLVSVAVAVIAVTVSTTMSGGDISLNALATQATQIFAVATIAYKILMADKQ